MDYSTEQICKVEELAKFLTPLSEMAVLMDVPLDELRLAVRDRNSAVSRAYYRAKAETSLALRKQEIELANVGSPLAVQLTTAYMVTMDSDEDL
jgi:hypothetical protein